MTFDEALEVLANSENNKLVKEGQLEYGLYRAYDVVGVLQKLKQEYAPTVEMTKEQHDLFINSTDFEKGQTNMDLGFGEMSLMQYAQIVMHPETIKIVDE